MKKCIQIFFVHIFKVGKSDGYILPLSESRKSKGHNLRYNNLYSFVTK